MLGSTRKSESDDGGAGQVRGAQVGVDALAEARRSAAPRAAPRKREQVGQALDVAQERRDAAAGAVGEGDGAHGLLWRRAT